MHNLLNTGGQWFSSNVYGEGSGSVLIGRLYCSGSETNLLECDRNSFAVTDKICDHSFDVGIKCEGENVFVLL